MKLSDRLDIIERKLDTVIMAIQGDMTDPMKPGIRAQAQDMEQRIYNLERAERRRSWSVRALWLAFTSALGKWIMERIGE